MQVLLLLLLPARVVTTTCTAAGVKQWILSKQLSHQPPITTTVLSADLGCQGSLPGFGSSACAVQHTSTAVGP
jgi:hypothetical protein